jgi:putative endonuclease
MKQAAVYIMASRRNGTLYTGVTANLLQRVHQHRDRSMPGFTARYGCTLLVWHEPHDDMSAGDRAREADQGWIAPQETRADRGDEPGLARSV